MFMSKKSCSEDTHPLAEDCKNCENRAGSLLCSDPEVLDAVVKAKTTCRFKTGQVIFYADNDPLGVYTIQKGLVKLEVSTSNGAAHTLRIVGPGGTLGYRSLFAGEPYHASAIAVEDCELCFVPRKQILDIFQMHPELTMKLLGHISKDLRVAEEKWLNQMDKGAPSRIAEALLFLQENFAHQNWTRREIAQWAGTTPETVIRTLAQFEKEGLIDQKEGRIILILSKELLKAKAESL